MSICLLTSRTGVWLLYPSLRSVLEMQLFEYFFERDIRQQGVVVLVDAWHCTLVQRMHEYGLQFFVGRPVVQHWASVRVLTVAFLGRLSHCSDIPSAFSFISLPLRQRIINWLLRYIDFLEPWQRTANLVPVFVFLFQRRDDFFKLITILLQPSALGHLVTV